MAKPADTFLRSSLAWCPLCKRVEQAVIVAASGGVFMERLCSEKSSSRVKLAADHKWYLARAGHAQAVTRRPGRKKVERGCPFDCGLCECHTAAVNLPVFSITNDCNLSCPICFTYNRPDKRYYKSVTETEKIIDAIIAESGGVELINLTGGEPTLHPDILAILSACKRRETGRITMNTNGLRIGADRQLAMQLKAANVQLVLSLDTLEPLKSVLIHGRDITAEKKRALAMLEELDIPTTILPVCIKGVNEEDVGEIVETYLPRKFVRSITIQNMTFTGKNGAAFKPRDHITLDEVEALLARRRGFSQTDFFPHGSYHPLCYSTAYYIVHAQKVFSLSKLIPVERLIAATSHGYLLKADSALLDEVRRGLDRLWAEGGDEDLLAAFRQVLQALSARAGAAETADWQGPLEGLIKMVCIHAHMDEDNFDLDRICRCGDVVPDEAGNMVPACSYNLFYRQKDERFWIQQS